MIVNQSWVDNFESEVKSVLNCDYVIDGLDSRSSCSAICSEMVSLSLSGDEGITQKEVAWEFNFVQETYEVNVVARNNRNSRIVWKGKGLSAREAYANLSKI